VRWLPLAQAMARLTHEREKLFLEKVGRQAMRETASRSGRPKPAPARHKATKSARKRVTIGSGGTAARRVAEPGHQRREGGPALAVPVAAPVQGPLTGLKPPAIVRKLWTFLRR
jgi:hypothetical protein